MYFKPFPKLFYPTGKTKTIVPDIFRRVHLDKFFAKTKLVRFFPIKQIFIILFNFINKN